MAKKNDKVSLTGLIESNEDLIKFILRQNENQFLLAKALDSIKDFLQEVLKVQKGCRDFLIGANKSLAKFDSYFIECKKSIKNQEEYLKESNKLHQMVDESLGNMLLAINQNEFLQAWYPEQHGYKEMKVVGQHPAKIAPAKPK